MLYQCKVSVIIAVYNMEEYIEECLKSVINQTLKEIEIICIDDCSTDSSATLINMLQSKDKRIEYFKLDKNSGSGPARNKGIEIAKGNFVIFMDPDDFYYSNTVLELLYIKAIKNNVNIVAGNMLIYDVPTQTKSVFITSLHFEEEKLYSFKKDYPSCFGYQSFLFSTNFLRSNNLYFPHYLRRQDPVFLLNVMLKNDIFYGVDKYIYVYRIFHKKINWNNIRISDAINSYIDNFKLLISENLFLHYNSEFNEFKHLVKENEKDFKKDLRYLDLMSSIPYTFLKKNIVSNLAVHEKEYVDSLINTLDNTNKQEIVIYGFGNIGVELYERIKNNYQIKFLYDKVYVGLKVDKFKIIDSIIKLDREKLLIVLTIYNDKIRDEEKEKLYSIGFKNII